MLIICPYAFPDKRVVQGAVGCVNDNYVQNIMSEVSKTPVMVNAYCQLDWMKEYSRTVMKHTLECLWGFLQRNLTEKEGPTLSVRNTVLWAGVLEWIKVGRRRHQVKRSHFNFPASWLASWTNLFLLLFLLGHDELYFYELKIKISPHFSCFWDRYLVTVMRKEIHSHQNKRSQ